MLRDDDHASGCAVSARTHGNVEASSPGRAWPGRGHHLLWRRELPDPFRPARPAVVAVLKSIAGTRLTTRTRWSGSDPRQPESGLAL